MVKCFVNMCHVIFMFLGEVNTIMVLMLAKARGQPELNRRPLDLQSNALPLSYIPTHDICR